MSPRTLGLFALLCVCWGIPYFFIKIALIDVPPVDVAWGRITLAAFVLIPLAWQRGVLRQALLYTLPIAAFAITELVIPFSLIAIAERALTSSLTGVLLASVPLTVILIAPLFGVREIVHPRRLVGLLFGLAGVAVLLGCDFVAGPAHWMAVGCLVLAVAGYAAGPLIVQRYLSEVDEIGSLALSLACASLLLLPVAIATAPQRMPAPASLAAVGVLGLICTAAALLLYFHVIHAAGAARASVVAYISPAIAAVLGVGILHEPFGVTMAAGLGMVLLGSALASGGRKAPTRTIPV